MDRGEGKKYLNAVQRNLTEIICKYELSCNGANQATHNDSNNEVDKSDEERGRFNAEQARRVAERRRRDNDIKDTSNDND